MEQAMRLAILAMATSLGHDDPRNSLRIIYDEFRGRCVNDELVEEIFNRLKEMS